MNSEREGKKLICTPDIKGRALVTANLKWTRNVLNWLYKLMSCFLLRASATFRRSSFYLLDKWLKAVDADYFIENLSRILINEF